MQQLKVKIDNNIGWAQVQGSATEQARIYTFGGVLEVSDGSHTISELYEHRHTLFIALCRQVAHLGKMAKPWRSKKHFDGGGYDGYFLMGMGAPGKQISYHLPMSYWHFADFAETLDKAPEWDGHTAQDVLERLKNLISL